MSFWNLRMEKSTREVVTVVEREDVDQEEKETRGTEELLARSLREDVEEEEEP